jgi:hypothetical protein
LRRRYVSRMRGRTNAFSNVKYISFLDIPELLDIPDFQEYLESCCQGFIYS